MTRALVFASLVAAMVLGGCTSATPTAPDKPETSAVHPADEVAAARYLPAAVQAMAYTDDLTGLLDAGGKDELLARLRKSYETAAFALVQQLGYNLISLGALEDLGVELHGQAGVALLAEGTGGSAAQAFFLTLSHPDRFKNLAYILAAGKIGKQKMTMSVVGDAVVLARKDLGVILAGPLALVVSHPSDAGAIAARLAGQLPEESLAAQRSFRVALRGLDQARPLRGYFDARAALYYAGEIDPRWPGATREAALEAIDELHKRALAGARKRSAAVKEMVAIDERYERARTDLENDRFSQRMRKLFGGIGGGGFSVAVRPNGLDVAAGLDVDRDAPLARLLVQRKGKALVLSALEGAPSAMVGLSLEPKVLIELARAFELPLSEANLLLGLDLDTELRELITGEIGVAVSPPKGGLAAVSGSEDLRIAAVLGVRSAKTFQLFLDRLAAKQGLKDIIVPGDKPRTWRVTLPDFPALTLALSEGALAIASDPALAARVSKASAMPLGGRAGELVSRDGNLGEALIEVGALIAAYTLGANEVAPIANPVPFHDPRVPKSPEYEAKLAELTALDAKIASVEAERDERTRRAAVTLLEPLGQVGVSLRPRDHGLALEAAFRTRGPSVASILGAVADRASEGQDDSAAELAKLAAERKKVARELEALYLKDKKAAAPPPPPPPQPDPKGQPNPKGEPAAPPKPAPKGRRVLAPVKP